ncbi:MAG: adenosylhomocysteinase [Methanobacteriota archaeon]|nr:MAG: adenosylhomocysteinase [Euryarchaeota archaeon]
MKNIGLAEKGHRKIEWAEKHMPVLRRIRKKFEDEKPLLGYRVGMALHVESKTAVLVNTLVAAGASVAITGCNPLSTQDDVAAALAEDGVEVHAWRGETKSEYYQNLSRVLNTKPDILVDDGGDLIHLLHTHPEHSKHLKKVVGGCEETTTGILRLRNMEKKEMLKIPVIAVNDAKTKYLFDNRHGTGQSTLEAMIRATNLLIAGKTVVIAGYGWCGRGIARRAQGMGANVIITEVDPVKGLEAAMDGYQVMPMLKAASLGDIFITTTGCKDVITKQHFPKMKHGAILANSGHFNNEINIQHLEQISTEIRHPRECVTEYVIKKKGDRKSLFLLGDGRLVNLACGDGHPCEVMDMSFSLQALSIRYLAEHGEKLSPGVHPVPGEIDRLVATYKLESLNLEIDTLTEDQKKYLSTWEIGT